MRIVPPVELRPAKRTPLTRWTSGHQPRARLVLRAKIILTAADEKANQASATKLGTRGQTLELWRQPFGQPRVAGLEKDALAVAVQPTSCPLSPRRP